MAFLKKWKKGIFLFLFFSKQFHIVEDSVNRTNYIQGKT